jgi:hypothetical protein
MSGETVLDKQCFDLTRNYQINEIEDFLNEGNKANIIIRHYNPVSDIDTIFCYNKTNIRERPSIISTEGRTYYQILDEVYVLRSYYDIITNTTNDYRFFDIRFEKYQSTNRGLRFNVYAIRNYTLSDLAKKDKEILERRETEEKNKLRKTKIQQENLTRETKYLEASRERSRRREREAYARTPEGRAEREASLREGRRLLRELEDLEEDEEISSL